MTFLQHKMTRKERKWFEDNGYIKPKNRPTCFSLRYGDMTFPNATNVSYALCVIEKKQRMREASYPDKSKFRIISTT